jgi:hypothetical protein
MRLRHDAKLEVTVKPKWGPFPERTDVVDAELLDAHITVMSAMYVGNSLSRHGSASITYKVISGELTGDELCTCEKCESGFYD